MNNINGLSVFSYGDENSSKTILFVHGFPLTSNMWKHQINYFKGKYRCVAYDLRGLGISPAGDGQFTLESFVDDLYEIVAKLNLDKPILCGLSMGGYIALRAVENFPDLFGGLILLDTKSDTDNNEGKLKRAAGIKRINAEGVVPFIADFIPMCFYKNSIERLGKEYDDFRNEAKQSSAAGVKGCLLAMQGRTDTTESLSNIKIPTLVLCGEFDGLTPPAVMESMAKKISGAKYFVVQNAGHLSQFENPEEVNKRIEAFLAQFGV